MQRNISIMFMAVSFFFSEEAIPSCGPGYIQVIIFIIPDSYPLESSWSLRDLSNNILIDSGGANSDTVCVPSTTCLKFTMFDSYGDGMCCSFGNGSYTISADGLLIGSGGIFTHSQTTYFNCPAGLDCSNPLIALKDTMTAPSPETWYSFTPDSTGMYEISSCDLGNTCDVRIYMYDHCQGILITENNVGTTFYDDNGCGVGLQAKISAALIAGTIFFIRVGDDNNNCTGQTIKWQIKYQGPIHGCTDSASCTFNPFATIDDASCIYSPDARCPAPDLTVDEQELKASLRMDNLTVGPVNCYIYEGCLSGYGKRRLLRFTTHIRNIGDLDYFIGTPDSSSGQFVYDACHGHWHYVGYAEYLIYNQKSYRFLQQGFKNGFCVTDLECDGGGQPKYGCGSMGLSAGCGDIYTSGIDCQWIDITDIDTGNYTLIVRVNWDRSPDKLGRSERSFSNNQAQVCFHLDFDSLQNKVFTILQNCPDFVDCAGDTFGTAKIDCAGACNGIALQGDADLNYLTDSIDVAYYLDGIKNETILFSNCLDLNGDSLITVTDAARLNGCLLFNAGNSNHSGPLYSTQKHCEFPFNIYNPNDFVSFSIADTNLLEHYIDLEIYNPTCQLLAYELKLSGLVIDSVKNLIMANYQPTILFSSTGHIVGISLDELSLAKQLIPLNFLRVYYSSLSDSVICISEVIAVINSNYEEVNHDSTISCLALPQKGIPTAIGNDIVEEFSVIPNPSAGVFEIYLQKPMSSEDIRVFNTIGKIFYPAAKENNGSQYIIDLSGEASGIYLLQLISDGRKIIKKIVLVSHKP